MKLRSGAAAFIVAALAVSAPAQADDFESLMALDLPVIAGSVPVHYSPSAETEAMAYAQTFARAVAWYRDTLAWDGAIAMAVLNPADYDRVSAFIPYPVPYADTGDSGRLVVMPDRIDTFPGFDAWDIDPITLNAALTLHEVGHIIAAQTGIESGNHWVTELIADVFLAGYARAEEPAFTALLNGVPPRFHEAGVLTYLTELDLLYARVGLENYAWFQFRLADIADFMVTGRDFATVIGGLRAAFPASGKRLEPIEDILAKLETIAPGVSALATDMTTPTLLPAPPRGPCTVPPTYTEGSQIVFIENASQKPLRFMSYDGAALMAGVELMTGEISEEAVPARAAELLAAFAYATTLEPGESQVERATTGDVYMIDGGGCFVIPDVATRFVWSGSAK